MIILFLSITLNIILVSGSSFSDKVHQTPADMYNNRGETLRISCSHSIDSYNRILWYRQSKGQLQFLGYMLATSGNVEKNELDVKIEGNANKGETCTLTIEGLSLNSSAVYFCAASFANQASEAYFGGGTKLTVLDPELKVTAPTVEVLRPSAKECRNQRNDTEKTIVCLATGFYPDHVSVSWQVGGVETIAGVATDNAALQGENKYYTITSRLRVSAKDWYSPNTEFRCTVRFFDGKDTEPYFDSIFGDEAEKRETYLNITQTAKLSYGVFIIKSMVYGVFVSFLVWKLQKSTRKQN